MTTIILDQLLPAPLVSLGINPASGVFGVRATLEAGKSYLAVAPSGKGKSTLLHILYGLRTDYAGQVELNGQNISALSPGDWAVLRQEKLSIVFQDLRLFPQLTAWENIRIKTDLASFHPDTRLRDMAGVLGLTELLDQKAGNLSYGQRQRVAILRALSQPFEVLLLDEPFSHLDEANTALALQMVREEVELRQAMMLLVSLGEDFGLTYDAVFQV